MTNLKKVEEKALELGNDVLKVKQELKRLQAVKHRLKKAPGKSNFQSEMTKVLQEEELVKMVRQLLEPKEKTVTTYEQKDIDILDYDQTIKALKSIQSKKSNTKWLTTEPGNNDEYKDACRIEQMLLEHKKSIGPIEETTVRKSDLVTIIDTIKTSKLSQERIIELLESLI